MSLSLFLFFSPKPPLPRECMCVWGGGGGARAHMRTCTLVAQMVVCQQCKSPKFNPWIGKISWRRKWQPTTIFLPGKSNGQRNLAGYIVPWSHTWSDMIEKLILTFSLTCAYTYIRILGGVLFWNTRTNILLNNFTE